MNNLSKTSRKRYEIDKHLKALDSASLLLALQIQSGIDKEIAIENYKSIVNSPVSSLSHISRKFKL